MAKFQDKENLKGSKGETGSNIQGSLNKVSSYLPNGNSPSQKRMAKTIPSSENQRPATKTTLPTKALNQDRRPNKEEFPRQMKSKRIYLHQTSSAKDAKETALRKGWKRETEREREREREKHKHKKNGNE